MAEYIEKTLITTELPFVMMKYGNYFNERQIEKIVEIVYELENSIEAADVQPVRRGKWLNNHAIWIEQPEIEGYFVQAECSECGRWAHEMKPYTRFLEYEKCPHCGAVMSTKG